MGGGPELLKNINKFLENVKQMKICFINDIAE